jgi:hypothetical protein
MQVEPQRHREHREEIQRIQFEISDLQFAIEFAFARFPPHFLLCVSVVSPPDVLMSRKPKPNPSSHRKPHRKELPDRFQLLIDCRDELQQRRLYEWLVAKKYACRVLLV